MYILYKELNWINFSGSKISSKSIRFFEEFELIRFILARNWIDFKSIQIDEK